MSTAIIAILVALGTVLAISTLSAQPKRIHVNAVARPTGKPHLVAKK